jgi:hypothetical protein
MSGKSIIFTLISFILFNYYIAKKHSTFFKIFLIIFVIVICVSFIAFISVILQENVLAQSKLSQVISVLDFNWIFNPYLLDASPQYRVIQFYNIVGNLIKNPQYLIFGKGFGGYFSDDLFYHYGASTDGGYSAKEVSSRKFVNPHSSVNEVLLRFGLMGVVILFITIKQISSSRNLNYFEKIIGITLLGTSLGFSIKLCYLVGYIISKSHKNESNSFRKYL